MIVEVLVVCLSAVSITGMVCILRVADRAVRLGYQMGRREDVTVPEQQGHAEFDMLDARDAGMVPVDDDEELEDEELT